MKVNGLRALRLGKVLESLRGQMAQFMRDSSLRVYQMGLESMSLSMVIFMKDSIRMA